MCCRLSSAWPTPSYLCVTIYAESGACRHVSSEGSSHRAFSLCQLLRCLAISRSVSLPVEAPHSAARCPCSSSCVAIASMSVLPVLHVRYGCVAVMVLCSCAWMCLLSAREPTAERPDVHMVLQRHLNDVIFSQGKVLTCRARLLCESVWMLCHALSPLHMRRACSEGTTLALLVRELAARAAMKS